MEVFVSKHRGLFLDHFGGSLHMGVTKNRGTPNGWFIMENPILKWMIWGYHYFGKHPYKQLSKPSLFRCMGMKSYPVI